jgi:DNA mismatch repair protein MSH2
MELALAALSAAIDHMNLKSGKQKQFSLKKYTLSQYLRLDVAALKALNVFPQNAEGGGVAGQAGSIFGMLNQCKTSIGARLLKKWLKQPTTDRDGKEQF